MSEFTKETNIEWPKKSRDLHNHHFDSTMWDGFDFRNDDIIIGTYGKSGTTWTQQIVGQLIFNGDPNVDTANLSPWVDLRLPPKEIKLPAIQEQTHRRFLKTHLPVDALNFSSKAKYLYLVRDGRDVAWSMYNHHYNANDMWYNALNESPGLVGPKIEKPKTDDVVEYYREWISKDGYPFWNFWENLSSWWAIKDLPNVQLIHFADLKKDMPSEIRKIASFLEIEIDESKWDDIVKHCTFDWMKEVCSTFVCNSCSLFFLGFEISNSCLTFLFCVPFFAIYFCVDRMLVN